MEQDSTKPSRRMPESKKVTATPTATLSLIGLTMEVRLPCQFNRHNMLQLKSLIQGKDTLKKFWEIEELSQGRHFIKEKQTCEEDFRRMTKRNHEGQIVVKQLQRKRYATPRVLPAYESQPRHIYPTSY